MRLNIGQLLLGSRRAGGGNPDFIITVDTTKAGSAADTIILPATGAGYDCEVFWGDGDSDTYTGTPGLTTIQHTYAVGGEKQITIVGDFPRMYFNDTGDNLKLLSIDNWGNYGLGISDQSHSFYGCENNTSIAEDWKLDAVLDDGAYMFRSNPLTSLPSGMALPLLENGSSMFRSNSLTSLPSGMELPLLTSGYAMFHSNSLTSLPSGMALPLLENGSNMFRENPLTSLPSGMALPLLDDGSSMFHSNTINTTDYSNLLIAMEAANSNTGVNFHGGSSKYNAAGEVARNALLARDPVWVITDSGLEV